MSLFEDHEGALWVGTWTGGLNRLDRASGKITRFQHDPEDPGSLSNNFVRAILEDSRGRLWVGTDYGLNLFDRATGRFFQYHYDPNDPHSLSSDSIWDIYEDRSGVLWFGTVNGISKLNETASSFTHYQQSPSQPSQGWGAQSVTVLDPHDPPGLSDNAVSSVYQDRQGILWIGTNTTYRGELNRLDRATGSRHGVPAQPRRPHQPQPRAGVCHLRRSGWNALGGHAGRSGSLRRPDAVVSSRRSVSRAAGDGHCRGSAGRPVGRLLGGNFPP